MKRPYLWLACLIGLIAAAPPLGARDLNAEEKAVPSPGASRETEIISGMKESRQGTFTSTIHPEAIDSAQPLNTMASWKSPEFSTELRGLAVGDVNGDGLNEIVMIDDRNIFIYQKKGNEFRLVQEIPGKRYDSYIAVDVADINRNGVGEIIVSTYAGALVDSFVLEFRNGRFETIAHDLRWFMRVIENASGAPLLMGQLRGVESAFTTPIHEIVWQNGAYREGRRMPVPVGLAVYGLTLDKLAPGGAETVIALNEDDYLCLYRPTDKPLSRVAVFGGSEEFLWKSDDVFGGSNTFVEPIVQTPAVEGDDVNKTRYINQRILTCDTNNDGKREIIIVKNHSSAKRLFERVKLFTSAEVFNLEWDGMGMVENWRTRKITGYVADYQFKDMDNDGKNELVLAVVVTGTWSFRDRSVLIAYQLK